MILSFQQGAKQQQYNSQQLKLNTGHVSLINQNSKQPSIHLLNENNLEIYQKNHYGQQPNTTTRKQDILKQIDRTPVSNTHSSNDISNQNLYSYQSVQPTSYVSNRNPSPFYIPQNKSIPIVVQNADPQIQTLKNNNLQPVQRNRIFSNLVQPTMGNHTRNLSGNQLNMVSQSPHFVQQKVNNQSVLIIPQNNSSSIQIPTQINGSGQQQLDQHRYFQSNIQQSNILTNQPDSHSLTTHHKVSEQNKNEADKQQQILKQIQLLKNIDLSQSYIQKSNQKQKQQDNSVYYQNDSPYQNNKSYFQEDTQLEDMTKLKSEIEYLNNKLKLKEEEVNIFTQYINERKEFEKEKIILIQQLEEARAEAQFLKLQQSKNLKNESNGNLEFKDQVLINQNEIILLNKEIQNLNKQIQYSEHQIHNKDESIKELKQKVEDQNILIKKQNEEIFNLKKQIDSSQQFNPQSQQIESIQIQKDLEQQNQLYLLKIQSLERNLVILEKENRNLKKKQEEQDNTNLQKE